MLRRSNRRRSGELAARKARDRNLDARFLVWDAHEAATLELTISPAGVQAWLAVISRLEPGRVAP